ncbi:MAG: MMPL family transporter, partial [Thermoleophilaceae bacterium]
MSGLSRLPAGRRSKWVILVIALAVAVAGASQARKFEDAQENEPSSFLPDDNESLRVRDALPQFQSGRLVPAVVVYQRAEGLTDVDQEEISFDREALAVNPPEGVVRVDEPVTSDDGTTALLTVDISGGGLVDATKQVRRTVAETPPGLDVAVTGRAGFATDQFEAFESLDRRLLLGTAALVLLLLVAIYRSPIFWAIPFVAVVLAELTSRGLGYGLTELGVTVNGQSASILVVLVFGAGTDYALLLVARYREELRRHEDKHAAMATALRRAGPAIVASGLTVIAALLCLSLAELNATAGLGPIAAMGIALAMVTMLTLLPALAVIGGRRAFWPLVPRPGEDAAPATRGVWRRVGERIACRPRTVWIAMTAVLAVMCAGLAVLDTDLTTGSGFREDVEAVEGQELLVRSFPAGESAPAVAVVGDPARAEDVAAALEEHPAVARTGPVERGPPGARFDVILEGDPYGRAGLEAIPRLRRVAGEAGGATALIGGPTAEERDLRTSAIRDNRLIAPVVLLVVFAILAVLLRAIVAPLLLVLTVIGSFAAALGAGAFVFQNVLGFEGVEPTLPLFAFIFLVALGVDYNIFLMARVREEALAVGTREGVLRGLAVTGGVITSAGIVLAGTFSILATLPLVTLAELGFVVAFGVLLDTFLVRSVLVPALILDAGRRSWWPSRLAREDGGAA